MIYNLVITAVAEEQILNACDYYESQLIGLSERFLTELHFAYNKIATNPEHYSFIAADHKYRDITLHKFPFVVIYEIKNYDVIVLAIFNTHRKPMY